MSRLEFVRDPEGRYTVRTAISGRELLTHPLLNKGTAFTPEERRQLSLEGLLPHAVDNVDVQCARALAQFRRKEEDLERFIGLAGLQDRNEVLFYRLLLGNLEELMPIVYTPVVGAAIMEYSRILRRPRGVWITPEHRGRIAEILRNAPHPDIRLIVVTDNERILGLGDQGAGGIGIPIGKLALYTALAGIHPSLTLPISLDVGTNNEALRDDPAYIGYRGPRLRGDEYNSLVAEFIEAVKEVFPRALLQWEDFKKQVAFDNLDLYRDALPSFNDDIEGTAGVAVAGLLAAARVTGVPLRDQRVVIAGAGAAGVGIGRLIRDAKRKAGNESPMDQIVLLDSRGPLVLDREYSDQYKRELATPSTADDRLGLAPGMDLEAVINAVKPHALIGTTGMPNSFPEAAIRAMAEHVERPCIFPYSNPTSQAEAHPADLLKWTDGRALVASGSPFGVVEHDGKRHRIGQGNNAYVFPGVGLGVLVSGATKVVPTMFSEAARVIAEMTTEEDLAEGSLYPRIDRLREVTRAVAIAVAAEAVDEGVAPPMDPAAREKAVDAEMWEPEYPTIVPVED